MTEQEVKDYIGEDFWDEFCYWITGQTCGLNEDGTSDYYDWDVEAFKRILETGYDRQEGPAWD